MITRLSRLQPVKEACPRRGLEHADHGGDDAALLNEIDLPLENGRPVTVKTDNKAAHHLQPCAMDDFDAFQEIPVFILGFVAFRQTDLIGRLDADKNGIESGRYHHVQKFRVIGEIDGGFREKNTSLFIFAPFDQGRKQMGFKVGSCFR